MVCKTYNQEIKDINSKKENAPKKCSGPLPEREQITIKELENPTNKHK